MKMTIMFFGHEYSVKSIADAQKKWIKFRDDSAAGVSEIGNGVEVRQGGVQIARISYNGRIWMDDLCVS